MTLDEFQQKVVASDLVDKDDAAAIRMELMSDSLEAFAHLFIVKKLLTVWQCKLLLEGRYKGFFVRHYKLLDHLGDEGAGGRYLVENLHTRKLAFLISEPPRPGVPCPYRIEKLKT